MALRPSVTSVQDEFKFDTALLRSSGDNNMEAKVRNGINRWEDALARRVLAVVGMDNMKVILTEKNRMRKMASSKISCQRRVDTA